MGFILLVRFLVSNNLLLRLNSFRAANRWWLAAAELFPPAWQQAEIPRPFEPDQSPLDVNAVLSPASNRHATQAKALVHIKYGCARTKHAYMRHKINHKSTLMARVFVQFFA